MFTIGDFSRLSCTSARMLRHYDSIGLLHPVGQGAENGYRYYDMSQLAIIRKIEWLKKYEFTKIIPGGLYVTTIHNGSMKDITKAYEGIMSWLSINTEYQLCGAAIERLIQDDSTSEDESNLKTAVLFPASKK